MRLIQRLGRVDAAEAQQAGRVVVEGREAVRFGLEDAAQIISFNDVAARACYSRLGRVTHFRNVVVRLRRDDAVRRRRALEVRCRGGEEPVGVGGCSAVVDGF